MTVIRPNGISGITSITSSGDAINFYKSDGTLGPVLGLNINATSGISTFAALNVTGVLTYEDVTSVDSVGIITARSDLSIADKIIHTGDTNTAIRFPAADTITAETGGSERVRIDSSGRVMIGNTAAGNLFSSANNLVVGSGSGHQGMSIYAGTTSNSNIMFADGTGTNSYAGYIQFSHSSDLMKFGIQGNDAMYIDSSKRVLIGTTTEGYSTADDLTIATSGSTGMTIRSGTSNYGSIHFSDATSGTGEYAGVIEYSHANDSLALYTTSALRLTIDSSGRLLLGTTTEGQQNADNLTIADSGHCGLTIRSGTTSGGAIYFSDATSGGGEYDGYIEYNHHSRFMRFGAAQDEAMRIDSSGNMGLGTASNYADSKLEVRGTNAGGDVAIRVTNNTTTNGSKAGIIFTNSTGDYTSAGIAHLRNDNALIFYNGQSAGAGGFDNAIERMRIDSSGRLLLGTTTARTDFYSGALSADIQLEDSSYCAYSAYVTNGNAAFIFGRGNPISGSIVGNLSWMADDGTDEVEVARISAQIDGTPGSNDMPGRIIFSTTADGAASTTERMRISQDGSVQISYGGNGYATLFKYGTTEDNYITHGVSGKTIFRNHNNAEYMRIDSTGRLLIGATSYTETAKLVVNTATSGGGIIAEFRNEINPNYGGLRIIGGINDRELRFQTTYGSSYFTFFTQPSVGAAQERLRIDPNGNIGLGTISPQDGDGFGRCIDIQSASGGAVYMRHSSDTTNDTFVIGRDGGNSYLISKSGNIIFNNVGAERMRINSAGYAKHNGGGGSYYNATSTHHEFTTNNNAYINIFYNSHASQPYGLFIKYQATPNNTSNDFHYCEDGSAARFVVRSNGGIANYSGNNANLCDEREKKNIVSLDAKWDKVKSWELKKFHYKEDADTDDLRYGVIAQQVETTCPEVLTEWTKQKAEDAILDDDGNVVTPAKEEILRKGVKEQQMMWMAIKALQEAQTRIETLETANADLVARVTALEG